MTYCTIQEGKARLAAEESHIEGFHPFWQSELRFSHFWFAVQLTRCQSLLRSYCNDTGKHPPCRIDINIDSHYPLATFGLRACYPYGSLRAESFKLFAYSGDVQDLIEVIYCTGFQRLNFVEIPDSVTYYLGVELLKNHSSLKVLEFKDIDISGPMMWMVGDILKSSTTLEQLHFRNISFEGGDSESFQTDQGDSFMLLADGFGNNASLQMLSLEGCTLSNAIMSRLASNLA
jgi:hypothetical protein